MKLEQALEIQAKLDGQLEPSRDREVERWLREDASASALRDELLAVRKAIREHEPAAAVPESREFYWSQIQRRIAAEAAIESRGAKGGSLVSWIRWLAPALGIAALAVIVTMRSGTSSALADASVMTFHSDNDALTIHWIN
jgi:anti-sigma factor RsiW